MDSITQPASARKPQCVLPATSRGWLIIELRYHVRHAIRALFDIVRDLWRGAGR
jgi:hypothetical protein